MTRLFFLLPVKIAREIPIAYVLVGSTVLEKERV